MREIKIWCWKLKKIKRCLGEDLPRKWNGVEFELITKWERRHRESKGGWWLGEGNGYGNVDMKMMMGEWRWENDIGYGGMRMKE